MLAVGNLSCSLHGIRSRPPRRAAPPAPTSPKIDGGPGSLPGPPPPPPPAAVSAGDLVPRPRLRSLCDGALRLAATEPDHAAGSAVRALGYLAWGLDPEKNAAAAADAGGGDGGSGGGGSFRGDRLGDAGGKLPVRWPGSEAGAGGAEGRGYVDGSCGGEEAGDDEDDRRLQDKAVLALSTRLAVDKESLPPRAGSSGVGRGGAGDRRVETAAAKCRCETACRCVEW